MIADHLPNFYHQQGSTLSYTPLRSIMIDGHEVAWMECTGSTTTDESGQEHTYRGRDLCCECDFQEGVGWEMKGEQVYSLDGPERCLPRQAALHLRHLELRRMFQDKYADDPWDVYSLSSHTQEIILDLIEMAQAGEWIGERTNGAEFWGGYFYLQTVAAITDQFVGHLWDDVYELMADKKIGLEGSVIQAYREPPPARWDEHLRIEQDGWVATASLPGHREMAREWKLDVLRPDGSPAFALIPGVRLLHDPIFGPDVEDVDRAARELGKVLRSAQTT